jgi:hypothetical protein
VEETIEVEPLAYHEFIYGATVIRLVSENGDIVLLHMMCVKKKGNDGKGANNVPNNVLEPNFQPFVRDVSQNNGLYMEYSIVLHYILFS